MDDSYPPIKRAAWRPVDDARSHAAWDDFYARFEFVASGGRPQAVIKDPVPSVTFDLNDLGRNASASASIDALNAEALRAFTSLIPKGNEMLVLDWQHQSFFLDPHAEASDVSPKDNVNGYPTVYPDGDYYAFLTPDMNEGTFGHPWETSLCVFGPQLVATLGRTLATWLPVKRVNDR